MPPVINEISRKQYQYKLSSHINNQAKTITQKRENELSKAIGEKIIDQIESSDRLWGLIVADEVWQSF